MVNCYAGYTESERHPLSFLTAFGIPRGKGKEILRFALNDNLMVNCQWLIVMRGTRRIMYLV